MNKRILITGITGFLGSNQSISLNELAIKIQHQMDFKVEIISKFPKEIYNNLSRLVPNTNKITKHLA